MRRNRNKRLQYINKGEISFGFSPQTELFIVTKRLQM